MEVLRQGERTGRLLFPLKYRQDPPGPVGPQRGKDKSKVVQGMEPRHAPSPTEAGFFPAGILRQFLAFSFWSYCLFY